MKALVFDTETSGLISSRLAKAEQLPEVIEFYGAMVDFTKAGKYKVTQELGLLIKPDRMINELKTGKQNITRITGITNAMVKDAPAFKAVAARIISFVEQAPLAIAHNVTFDKEMLDIEAWRLNHAIHWPPVLCTVEATGYLRGDPLTLSELHAYLFGQKHADAHRAKADTHALIRCCAELYKRGVI